MDEPIPTELPPLADPPRAPTARVRRRAWADPVVRFWWLAAAVTLAAGIYLGVSSFNVWRHDGWLMTQPAVKATIKQSSQDTIAGRPVKPGMTMELQFPFGGRPASVWVPMVGYTGEPMTGQDIDVHVNPADENDLTIRNVPQALPAALVGGLATAALAIGPMLAAWWVRRRVLRTWRSGEARLATVLGRQQTPLAPTGRAARCVWLDEALTDRRIFSVYLPARSAEASADVIRVIAAPKGKGRPIAAAWLE